MNIGELFLNSPWWLPSQSLSHYPLSLSIYVFGGLIGLANQYKNSNLHIFYFIQSVSHVVCFDLIESPLSYKTCTERSY